ncbi:MAG TPA: response regulator [Dehalococcoidia bacterium]|jgi:twitching motility two-component system response regulator PilH|nr:response regulator [Dehalococcoidia bacterium]
MTGRPRTVLVIDADPDFLQFMRDLLGDEGHRVETADSVAAARARLQAVQPDAVISSLSVWGRDTELAGTVLVGDPQLAGIPLLVCSADINGLERLRGVAREAGLGLLAKPFAIDDLLDQLDRLLDRGDALGRLGGSAD